MTTTDAARLSRAGLARLLDHSVLKPESTVDEIVAGAEVVRAHRIGFYCVQPTNRRLHPRYKRSMSN